VFFSAATSFTDPSFGQCVARGEFAHAPANSFRAEAKRLAHDALSSMPESLGFKGRIVPFLSFVQGAEKLFFTFKVFEGHQTMFIDTLKKGSYFFNFTK
jgi:hypothetical protein